MHRTAPKGPLCGVVVTGKCLRRGAGRAPRGECEREGCHAEIQTSRGREGVFSASGRHEPHAARAADPARHRFRRGGAALSESVGGAAARPDVAERHARRSGDDPRGARGRRADLRLRRLRRRRRQRLGDFGRLSALARRPGRGLFAVAAPRGLRAQRGRRARNRRAGEADGHGRLRRDERRTGRAGEVAGAFVRRHRPPPARGRAAGLPGGQPAAGRLSVSVAVRRGRGVQGRRGARGHGGGDALRRHRGAGHGSGRRAARRRKPHDRQAGAGQDQRFAAPRASRADRRGRADRPEDQRREHRLSARAAAQRRRADRFGAAAARAAAVPDGRRGGADRRGARRGERQAQAGRAAHPFAGRGAARGI